MSFYLWIVIIGFLSGMLKGIAGFGGGLIALPLLALLMDIKLVVPIVLMLGGAGTILLLFQLIKKIEWKEIYPLLLGFLPGLFAGVFLLKIADKELIQLIVGLFLLVYSIYCLVFKNTIIRLAKTWSYVFGFFSGFLNGAIGAGGPPIIIYSSLQTWEKDKSKVTLQGFLIIACLITFSAYSISGIINFISIKYFLLCLPSFWGGILSGSYLYKYLNEISYQKIVFSILGILGVLLIFKH